jgi:hypothetical protein
MSSTKQNAFLPKLPTPIQADSICELVVVYMAEVMVSFSPFDFLVTL